MCIEYMLAFMFSVIVSVCICCLIINSLKTDAKLQMRETELEDVKAENMALKEVIRKQQIIINANER